MKTTKALFGILTITAALVLQVQAQPVTKVAAGGSHSLFLKSDGSLWGMGNQSVDELDDGTYSNGLLFGEIR